MKVSAERLRRLRNEIAIDAVLGRLNLPTKTRGGWLRFLCPVCGEFDTATNPKTNLGRCFRCQRNFNPIDLVIAERRCRFLEAVEFLEQRVMPAE